MRARDEDGAVAISTALILIVLVLLAAFLVDLGTTRTDARADQLLADTAVMAAANFDGNGREQCKEAVRFLAANVSDPSADPSACDVLPTSCSTSTPVATTDPIPVGNFTMRVTHPVSNGDASMIVDGQDVDAGPTSRDGTPCHRIKVEVTRSRDFTFAPAGGGAQSGSSINDAVAIRNVEDDPSEYATLVLLDQQRCQELTAAGGGSGGSGVVVQNAYDMSGNITAAGVIHLDSDGLDSGSSCNGGNRIVDAGSSTNSAICSGVDGRIPANVEAIFAASPVNCEAVLPVLDDTLRVKGSTNVALPKFLSGGSNDLQLEDDPLTVDYRITRSIVDHEYNCLHDPDTADGVITYPTDEVQYPSPGLVEPIPFCKDTNRSPHIDELIDATITIGVPPGFTLVPGGCSPTSPVSVQFAYINCETLPPGDYESDVLVLKGGSANPHGINGGTITMQPYNAVAGPDSAILVVQDGNVQMSTGDSFTFDRAFVYLHDGNMNINGGENLTWHAPSEVGYHPDTGAAVNCAPMTITPGVEVPHPSCFQNLALWTNTEGNPTGVHSMAGQGQIDVRGVFFGPKAHFSLSGSGSSGPAPLRLEDAQFFTRTLGITGGSRIAMKPNPNIFLQTPPPAIALIR